MTAPPQASPPQQARLAWIDTLRSIAMVLMAIDHTLLFFAPEATVSILVRATLTRAAEPLFIFTMTYLVCVRGKPMRWRRWMQITGVSIITSAILSDAVGYPMADILVSISLIALLLPILSTASRGVLVGLLHLSAALSMFSISVAHIAFDYSPVMLLHQAALVVAFHSYGVHFALRHAALASIVAVAIMLMNEHCASLSITSATMLLFGHPLAIIVIAQARSRRRFSMKMLGKNPLTFYVVHLLLLALVNVMLGFN